MNDVRQRRTQVQQLTERLIVEYAGALPAGQVLAAVVRAQRRLVREGPEWSETRTELCETLARAQLTRRLAPLATTG